MKRMSRSDFVDCTPPDYITPGSRDRFICPLQPQAKEQKVGHDAFIDATIFLFSIRLLVLFCAPILALRFSCSLLLPAPDLCPCAALLSPLLNTQFTRFV